MSNDSGFGYRNAPLPSNNKMPNAEPAVTSSAPVVQPHNNVQFQYPNSNNKGLPNRSLNNEPQKKFPVAKFTIIGSIILVLGLIVWGVVGVATAIGNIPAPINSNGANGEPAASTHDYEASTDLYWDKERNPFTGLPVGENYTGADGEAERAWTSGALWLEPPVSETPTEEFQKEYPDVNDFLGLVTSGGNQDLRVIVSSDPDVNCGLQNVKVTNKTVAGCYNPAYGNVLFMWWGDKAPSDVRTLVLFHIYSHYVQTWDNFDIMASLYTASLEDSVDKKLMWQYIEQDSTCQVYYGWGNEDYKIYDRQLANPCGTQKSWDSWWLADQVDTLGVTIRDW